MPTIDKERLVSTERYDEIDSPLEGQICRDTGTMRTGVTAFMSPELRCHSVFFHHHPAFRHALCVYLREEGLEITLPDMIIDSLGIATVWHQLLVSVFPV